MKKVLFVPGFKESGTSRNYQAALKKIENKGYTAKIIQIDWGRTQNVNDWVKTLEKEYSQHPAAETILAGFSFGAVTAFIAATHRNPSELWLFSLSGAFAEDWSKMEISNIKAVGKRRIKAFTNYPFHKLAKDIRCKTLLFAGDKELKAYQSLRKRVEDAHLVIKTSELIVVPNCGHDVTNPSYITAVLSKI